jgi:hypothetical protein
VRRKKSDATAAVQRAIMTKLIITAVIMFLLDMLFSSSCIAIRKMIN